MAAEDQIHLLWITENYPPSRGGMAQSCDRITYGLRKQGYQIHILHFTNRREPYKTDTLLNGSYTVIPVSESEAHTANLCWNMVNRMPYNFTKLVCFGGYMPMITGPVFSKLMNRPLVTFLRGNDFDNALFNPRRKLILDESMLASESIGCVTHDQQQKIKKLYPGVRTWYTPNGIDTANWTIMPSEEKFAQQWRKANLGDRLCLGMFGQLKEKKGLEVLLACFGKPVIARHFFLLLAGEYEETLEQTLKDLGIGYAMLPFMDRNELVRYYAASDIIVVPSHYEGMPNVLLEAGALGKPVIASEVGGMKDVLSDLKNKYLFYPGDSSQLENLLLKFLDMTEDERLLCGNELKKLIYDNFNAETELEPYIEVFSYEKGHRKSLV